MVKAVLFDLGNTLIEYPTPEALRENYKRFARGEARLDEVLLDRMHKLLMEERRVGFKTFEEATIVRALSRALRERGMYTNTVELYRQVGEIYHYGFSKSATLIDGAQELLECLDILGIKYRPRIKMGIVSNTPFPGYLFQEEMERFGIAKYFRTFVWSSEFGKRKPSPDIFLKALCNLGVAPNEAAFVGDKLDRDVAGSRGVGMTSIWFDRKGTGHDHDGYRVTSLKEIPELPGLF